MANSDRYRREDFYGRDDRGFVDRATDEVRSWFGDDEAETRRRRDDRDMDRGDGQRGAQGRPWADRGREWAERGALEDRRRQRAFPDPADERAEREPMYRGRDDDGATGWRRGGDWDSGRRETWPEDRGDVTPRHGLGPGGGWHVGKGPSGYTRSDERIREDVCDRLTDDPYVDATNIEVAVQGGEVTLSGRVDRRADKRRAEDIAERISGVREVNNRLRIGMAASGGLGTGGPAPAARS